MKSHQYLWWRPQGSPECKYHKIQLKATITRRKFGRLIISVCITRSYCHEVALDLCFSIWFWYRKDHVIKASEYCKLRNGEADLGDIKSGWYHITRSEPLVWRNHHCTLGQASIYTDRCKDPLLLCVLDAVLIFSVFYSNQCLINVSKPFKNQKYSQFESLSTLFKNFKVRSERV